MKSILKSSVIVLLVHQIMGCAQSYLSGSNTVENIYIEHEPIYSFEEKSCSKDIKASDYYSDPKALNSLLEWHLTSPEVSNPACMNNIGWIYHFIERDYPKAQEWYKQAVAQGNLDAMYNLALSYDSQSATLGNYNMAFSLYKQAAEHNHRYAQNNLAQMYMRGYGTDRNYTEAKSWLEKSSNQFYSVAFVQLGLLYERGYGVDQDYEQARQYYKQAAQLEDAIGELRLALLYSKGLGGGVDKEKAKLLLQSSASKENSYARYYFANEFDKLGSSGKK
ncbi:tetratricopeptide repeat protein [Vibrio lentus]|uniref:tetratricopeptide repeat protein n=1 Tax=Vibrio lentus TaxID=136468 RepID=UPI000C823AFE|nr:tetratricopeptide repeat protein [Vibrio lentus]PMI84874.1 hypothetical protein BCU36_04980 [Vibrio lentus]